MTHMHKLILLALPVLIIGCSSHSPSEEARTYNVDDVLLYSNGDILTMEGDSPEYAEAVVVEDGKIVYVGSKVEADKKFSNAKQRDLEGKTLVPGFVDGHIHFGGLGAQAVGANLLAEPDGDVNDIPALIDELKSWFAENGTDKTNGWIFGLGFDDAVLAEKRFPTKDDLDKVSTDIPICIVHISGHFCVMNSKGLEESGIDASSQDPDGGIIRRVAGTQEPNGVLEELAAIPLFFPIMSPKEPELIDYYLDKAQEMAARYGYTTVQEGRAMQNHEQIADYASRDKLYLDVVSYIDYAFDQYMDSDWYGREYSGGYRIGGLKLTLDGSPQGRTAWCTTPYLIPPEGQGPDYAGYPAIPNDEDVKNIIAKAFENDWQLLAHTNGDAAVDQYIRCMRPAVETYGNDDRRNVMIHGQYIRYDQLDSLKDMEVHASLFPMHTFYWGDWHKQLRGEEAGNRISPIRTALDKGLHVTSHTDAPVALPNLMMILWTTVNRISRSGAIIGENERLTPYEAMKCITEWGAYQHFEEDTKGTITAGKLADLVILDQNPLKVDPMELKDIEVLCTIKEGKVVYDKNQ